MNPNMKDKRVIGNDLKACFCKKINNLLWENAQLYDFVEK